MQDLHAPIFEDKIVDFIVELATVTDREVAVEELLKDPDETAAADASPEAETKPVDETNQK
jgi:trigger factor